MIKTIGTTLVEILGTTIYFLASLLDIVLSILYCGFTQGYCRARHYNHWAIALTQDGRFDVICLKCERTIIEGVKIND